MKKAAVLIKENHGRGKFVFGLCKRLSEGQGSPNFAIGLEHVVHLLQFVQT